MGRGTFIVRTASPNPLAWHPRWAGKWAGTAGIPRQQHSNTEGTNESHTVRERLLAMLAMFFGVVALLLAGVGLYGAPITRTAK
jgi:hypothetical protein